MKITRTNGQFQVLQDDGTLVTPTGAGNDQRTLSSLYSGGGGSPPIGPINPNPPTGGTPPPPSTGGTPPTTNPPAGGAPGTNLDPLSAMNFSIKSMLLDTQQGQNQVNQNMQAGTGAIKTAAATSDMGSTLNTGAPVQGLSPSQQDSARSAEAGVFDVANTTFKDKLNYFSKNLSDISSSLSQFGDIASIQLKATVTPQAIQGILAAYASGDTTVLNSLPAEARGQVYAALAQNPQVVQQHEEMLKRGILSGPKGGKYQPTYDAQGNITGYVPIIDPNSTPGSNFDSDLQSAVDLLTTPQEQGGSAGKDQFINPDAAIKAYEYTLKQYPSKSAQIKAAIKPYLNPADLQTNVQLKNIFGAGAY